MPIPNNMKFTSKSSAEKIKRAAASAVTMLPLLLITVPGIASAQAYDFQSLVMLFIGMIKTLVPLIVGMTLLYFMWGIFRLVQSNSEDARKEAIGVITYGVVSLFVMISVWGLVSILTSTFFGGGLVIPQLR